MTSTCKLVKNKNKSRAALLPAMPNGDIIPAIVIDSISVIEDDEALQKSGFVKVQFQVFVKKEDIETL